MKLVARTTCEEALVRAWFGDVMKAIRKTLLSIALAGGSIVGAMPAHAEEVGASDSQGVSLTIYNQNFGVVKDIRNMDLKSGVNYVRFSDVASQIDPTSVSLLSLTAPNSLTVREQNYQFDLIDPTTILSKSVGKTLKFRQVLDNGSVKEFSGVLINSPRSVVADSNGGTSTRYQGLVVKTDTGVILNPHGEIEIAELPAGLISKPSLVWRLETDKPGTHKTEVAYQTAGLNWKSDYVAILNAADNQLDLTSWVTLDNRSGGTYNNAALKLLAGDVHRVTPTAVNGSMLMERSMRSAAPQQQFKEQSFAEYHLYTLQGKTDVKDNETKQLSLFNADKIPAKKLFVYDPQRGGNPYYGNPSGTAAQKIQIKIEVENSQKNQLGIPMPKGKVRVYKRDTDGALQFIGEDQIDHTAKDEKVRLYIGDAFDVVGEHKLMRTDNISSNRQRQAFEVLLRNHKDTPISVVAVEHPYGDWTVMTSSSPGIRRDATNLDFNVTVPANGETKLTYEIETKW